MVEKLAANYFLGSPQHEPNNGGRIIERLKARVKPLLLVFIPMKDGCIFLSRRADPPEAIAPDEKLVGTPLDKQKH